MRRRSSEITRSCGPATAVDAADHAGAAAERDHGDPLARADLEHVGDLGGVAGHDHRVGRRVEAPAAQTDEVRVAASRRSPHALLVGDAGRSPGSPRRRSSRAAGAAAGSATSSSSTRRIGSVSPSSERSIASAAVGSADPLLGVAPSPPLRRPRGPLRGSPSRPPTSARSMPSSASSRRRRAAPRIIVEPSRESPRRRSSLVSVTRVGVRVGIEPDLEPRRLEDALERRPLDLLLPGVAVPGRRRCSGSRRARRRRARFRARRSSARVAAGSRTSSTRCVRGHQRGRLCGSETSSHTRPGSAAIIRVRETRGIASRRYSAVDLRRRRSRTSSRCLR